MTFHSTDSQTTRCDGRDEGAETGKDCAQKVPVVPDFLLIFNLSSGCIWVAQRSKAQASLRAARKELETSRAAKQACSDEVKTLEWHIRICAALSLSSIKVPLARLSYTSQVTFNAACDIAFKKADMHQQMAYPSGKQGGAGEEPP